LLSSGWSWDWMDLMGARCSRKGGKAGPLLLFALVGGRLLGDVDGAERAHRYGVGCLDILVLLMECPAFFGPSI